MSFKLDHFGFHGDEQAGAVEQLPETGLPCSHPVVSFIGELMGIHVIQCDTCGQEWAEYEK